MIRYSCAESLRFPRQHNRCKTSRNYNTRSRLAYFPRLPQPSPHRPVTVSPRHLTISASWNDVSAHRRRFIEYKIRPFHEGDSQAVIFNDVATRIDEARGAGAKEGD